MFSKKIALHTQIIIALFLGGIFGLIAIKFQLSNFTQHYIAPFGVIFLNSLKLIAVPLVISTLISGICNLKDVKKLGKTGKQSLFLYLTSTLIAITIGLIVVNIIAPWKGMPENLSETLINNIQSNSPKKLLVERKPLQFLEELIPENIFGAASNNANILQIIFFSVLLGISLLAIPSQKAQPLVNFFESLSTVIVQMVNYIMKFAPIGTFALISSLLVDIVAKNNVNVFELMWLLTKYGLTVVLALAILIFIFYPLAVKYIAKKSPYQFLKSILPAQLLAFSTSSSAATLPISLQCAEENLKIKKEITGFVLPLGATINMDGTSCYQGIAAVFIAQVLGFDLTLTDQISIVFTTTLASIGSAAVPGAGMVMLAIVLEQLKVPVNGIILIVGIDRLLDMCRTVVNVTGDLTVVQIISYWQSKK
jgi:proton glutamate symport protein